MFPRLVKVVINQCLKIETFAQGVVTTPLLRKVWMTEEMDVSRWEENLNTTVKQMFAKLDGLRTLEYVNLNDFPRLVELWHGDAQRVLDFKNLKELTFDNCSSLRFIFTESMALDLVQLRWLEVKNCVMMKEILRRGEGEGDGDEEAEWNMIKFPRLQTLWLESCCQLTCFSSGHNTQLEFPSLKTITVKKCPDMKTFVEAIDDGNVETHQWPFFSEKVLFPGLEEVTISNLENLGNIWPNQLNANAISRLRSIKVEGCSNLSSVFPATLAKSLLQLEELVLESCEGVEYIFAKDEKAEATTVTEYLFPRLSVLRLSELPKLNGLYPGLHTSEWTMLTELNIYHCHKIKAFTPISRGTQGDQLNNPTHQPLFNVEKDLSTLEELGLNSEDIKMINLHRQFPEELFFKLKTLNLLCFLELSAVIPLSFLQRFHNLETLRIVYSSFQELIPPCEAREGGEQQAVIFTRITKLLLLNLSSLTHLWKEDHPREPLIQNLKSLQVWKCPSLITLAPSSAYLQNLTYLEVWQCHGLINIMSSSTANSLVNLDTLKISECDKVTQIISNNEGCETEEEEIVFHNLEKLKLDRLSGLLSFCSPNNKLMFPCLVKVVINECPKMETFVQGVVSTPLLHRVGMNKPLLHGVWKEEKRVGQWEGNLNTTVQQIFAKMDGLRYLEHVNLTDDFPRLVELWQGDAQSVLNFKNIKVLKIDNCSSLKFIFTQSMAVHFVRLQRMEVKNCIMMEEIVRKGEGDEEEEWNRIKFPRLETLLLKSCPQLTCFYSGHNTQLEFPSLNSITIKKCPIVKTFAEAIDDENVETHEEEEHYDTHQTPFFSEKVLFPLLKKLTISHLENLGIIWSDQLKKESIRRLRSIEVEDCSNLSSIFPATVASSLLQLENLALISCGVEYIFAKDEKAEASSMTKFLFPRLTHLKLRNLPKLSGLYPGLHTSEWKVLKELDIYHCHKIKMYAPHSMNSQGIQRDDALNVRTQQPLFIVEKPFKTLELLTLNFEDIEMFNLHGDFSDDLFLKIKTLHLVCFHDASAAIALSFLQRFENLENLVIGCSAFQELLPPYEAREGGEEHAVLFTWITNLKLDNLSSLTHLWKEDHPREPVMQNLKFLEVWNCPSLITLAPSSAYLQNLTSLDVWKCHGLINIMSSSAANSLVNLNIIKIRECDKVTQIISNNEGCETEEEEIIFHKLEYLELDRLSGLLNFWSANHNFLFPRLVKVVINQCPKMETFVQGVVSTPLLRRVLMMNVDCWKGDLNTTIQQNVSKTAGLTE